MSDPSEQAGPIRVLVANMPSVVTQMLSHAMLGQTDLKLVGQVSGNVEVLMALQAGVDIIILGAQDVQPPPGICSHLFSEDPDLRILVLNASGDLAELYWLGLRQRSLRIVSMDGVLDTIRQAYQLDPMS